MHRGFLAGFVLLDLKFYALWIVVCPFVIFLLAIVLSVLFRFAASDYPFVSLKMKLTLMKPRFALIQL
jgi:hypothetical protein